jgi:magnesium chelatase subunit D
MLFKYVASSPDTPNSLTVFMLTSILSSFVDFQLAMLTGLNAQKSGDVGKVVVVLISDGRANVPLCVSMGDEFDPDADEDSKDGKPSRKYLKDEVLVLSKKLGSLRGFHLLCVDTENKFISTGLAKDIANAAMGKYHQITKADGKAIASVTNQALNAIKAQ